MEGTSFTSGWFQRSREKRSYHLHDGPLGNHLGENKTPEKLIKRFYWPGHATDVKMPNLKPRAPLVSVQVGYPMQMVATDILGPLPESSSGNLYILVAGDYFT